MSNYYEDSASYVGSILPILRSHLNHGSATSAEDMELILKSGAVSDPCIARDTFFVVAAKPNAQADETILEVFEAAWMSNNAKANQWPLIAKLAQRGLLLAEPAFLRIISSEEPKDWEVFLGEAIGPNYRQDFQAMWNGLAGETMAERIHSRPEPEWQQVQKLLNLLLTGSTFTPGL